MAKILEPLKGWTEMGGTVSMRSALTEGQADTLAALAGAIAQDVKEGK